ncbi:MAG: hypothetical protein ACFFD5_02775 [Candidatus Thorarchaeota archaeon]
MKYLIEKEIIIEGIKIFISLIRLHKSFLLLISDQEDLGIGNVTLGTPPIIKDLKSSTSSYHLFGLDRKLLSNIIAEKASSSLKKPVLLLLFLKTKKDDKEIIKPLIKFLNDIFEEIISEEKE